MRRRNGQRERPDSRKHTHTVGDEASGPSAGELAVDSPFSCHRAQTHVNTSVDTSSRNPRQYTPHRHRHDPLPLTWLPTLPRQQRIWAVETQTRTRSHSHSPGLVAMTKQIAEVGLICPLHHWLPVPPTSWWRLGWLTPWGALSWPRHYSPHHATCCSRDDCHCPVAPLRQTWLMRLMQLMHRNWLRRRARGTPNGFPQNCSHCHRRGG
jgi:hypothetical protein